MSQIAAAESESPLVAALNARSRTCHVFDATSAIREDALVDQKIAVREPTVGEEVSARIWAAKYAANNAGAEVDVDRAASTTLETIHVIASTHRLVSDPEHRPAFGPPEWLLARLTGDETRACLSLLDEVRRRELGRGRALDEEQIVELAHDLADADHAQAVERTAHLTRDELVQVAACVSAWWVGLMPLLMSLGDGTIEVQHG